MDSCESQKIEEAAPDCDPYRVQFTVADQPRAWMSAATRSIRWAFGVSNTAIPGEPCKGSIREVELLCTKRENKFKVYYDGADVTKIVKKLRTVSPTGYELSWHSRDGVGLRIVLLSKASDAKERYNLYVAGTSFFQLPTKHERTQLSEQRMPSTECLRHFNTSWSGAARTRGAPFVDDAVPVSQSLHFRLSMAGLSMGERDVEDELHSDKYSAMLEKLRMKITKSLPQAEEIVSMAITTAFCAESNSIHSCESFSTGSMELLLPSMVEANYLRQAYVWVRKNRESSSSQQLRFLQKRLDEIFMGIRSEQLSCDQAARIVLSSALMIGLKLKHYEPTCTVLLEGLPKNTSPEELANCLHEYGEVSNTALATAGSFGFCHFVDPSSLARLIAAADDEGVWVGGANPRLAALSPSGFEYVSNRGEATSTASSSLSSVPEPPPTKVSITSPTSVAFPSDRFLPEGMFSEERTERFRLDLSPPNVD